MTDRNWERLLTPDDVCTWLRVERRALYRLVARGAIPYVKLGSRLRFDRNAITQWLDTHRHDARPGRSTTIGPPGARSPAPPALTHHLVPVDRLLCADPGAG